MGNPIKAERDAVLFLVDCSSSMFRKIESAEMDAEATPGSYLSPFTRAIQCALSFYQEKVVTSDKDLVSLLLYNTRKKLNLYEFQGVYVFHEFDCPGAARVQELQVLSRAGSGDVNVHKEFSEHIGHGAPRAVLLSEAFWAAQHMFHNLRSRAIGFRRVFLFTDCDDPCAGIPMERERCFARMKDLHDAGVALEVFAHGADVVSSAVGGGGGSSTVGAGSLGHSSSAPTSHPGAPASTSHPLHHSTAGGATFVASPTGSGPHPHDVPSIGSSHGGAPAGPLLATTTAAVAALGTKPLTLGGDFFVRGKFWDPLVAAPVASKLGGSSGGGLSGSFDVSPDDVEYCGAVHVSACLTSFDTMVSDVKIRTNPQRSAGSAELRVGFGAAVPRVIVNIYTPILKCPKPKFTWLDGTTNTGVTSETRLLSKATGAPVAPAELRFSTSVAGEELLFSKDETIEMKKICSSNGGVRGFTILGFKKSEHAIRFKYNVARSGFLHCTTQKGGGQGALKFFVQLHRTLSTQNKVAIAEFVSRDNVAPRLVALLPSKLLHDHPMMDSVTGLGFHLIQIPYADDVRSFHPRKQPAEAQPTDDQITKAKRVIRKLQVEYDVNAIANPALQRQYKILQQLALIDPAPVQVDDLTLPDVEGMAKIAPTLQEFTTAVLPPSYSADMICPQPKAAKPPPSATEMAAIDFDDLESKGTLTSLTMPYLQQYLKLLKEDVQGAKLKHELVARVAEVVRKRRTVKREREEE
ncbi:KU70 protein, putative [Bodo saltans]|uniref:KU70 protein, putative n=1 Tax=Bodo saltans TaxID=75058 RepID=A0A0S4JJL6_BODSA|nr:KU70 protein, putative [Bodo saltans]|eukprot:CUG90337.1 KU70 protein, putative [Bodo saltans]